MPERDFYQVSLKVLLENEKQETLLLKAVDYGIFAGYYDLPGGRIDVDEFTTPFEDIIRRELKEEIGNCDVSIDPHIVGYGRILSPASMTRLEKDKHILYLCFRGKVRGEIHISDEHQGVRWVDLRKEDISRLFVSGILDCVRMSLEDK